MRKIHRWKLKLFIVCYPLNTLVNQSRDKIIITNPVHGEQSNKRLLEQFPSSLKTDLLSPQNEKQRKDENSPPLNIFGVIIEIRLLNTFVQNILSDPQEGGMAARVGCVTRHHRRLTFEARFNNQV